MTDSSSTVSWQTAFLSLFALAVNTMAQPCGRIGDVPPELSIWVRSSPLMCGFDTLCIIAQVLYYRQMGDTFKTALRRVMKYRFVDPSLDMENMQSQQAAQNTEMDFFPSEIDITDPEPLDLIQPVNAIPQSTFEISEPWVTKDMAIKATADIESRLMVRLVLFATTAIPVIGKLYTVSGLPWTKFWASMYLLSFLSVEIMVWMSKPFSKISDLEPIVNDFFRRPQQKLMSDLRRAPYPHLLYSNPGTHWVFQFSFSMFAMSFVSSCLWAPLVSSQASFFTAMVISLIILDTEAMFNRGLKPLYLAEDDQFFSMLDAYLQSIHGYLFLVYSISFTSRSWLLALLCIVHRMMVGARRLVQNSLTTWNLFRYYFLGFCYFFIWRVGEYMRGDDIDISGLVNNFLVAMLFTSVAPFAVPLYRLYLHQYFALLNLSFALYYYSREYNPTNTYSPSWEQIWG